MKNQKCIIKPFSLVFTLLVMLILYSCNKDNDFETGINDSEKSSKRSEDFKLSPDEKATIFDDRLVFGNLLRSTMIENDNFRLTLRNLFIETYSQNGGELMLAEILDRNVDESNTIEDILMAKLGSENFTEANQNFLTSIAQNDPLLTIDIPILDEVSNADWTETYVPGIIVGNYEYKDNFETMKFINQENEVKDYDVTTPKQEMTLYIKTSERFVAIPGGSSGAITGDPLHGFGEGEFCDDLLQAIGSLESIIEHGSYEDWHIVKLSEFRELYWTVCFEGGGNDNGGGSNNGGQAGGCTVECDRDCNDKHEYLRKWKLETLSVFKDVRCGLQKTITINVLPVFTKDGSYVYQDESISYQKAFSRHFSEIIHCNFWYTSCVALWQYPPAEAAWGWRMYGDWDKETFDKMFLIWTGFPDDAESTNWTFSLTGGYTVGKNKTGLEGSANVAGGSSKNCTKNVHALGSGVVEYCDDMPRVEPTGDIIYEQNIL